MKRVARGRLAKFFLIIAGLLFAIGLFWIFWIWINIYLYNNLYRPLQTQIQTFPQAKVTTQQVNDFLVVTVPQSELIIEMVFVSAGKFPMGSTDEKPIHNVYLDDFWIDRTEVTNDQFTAFVNATGYETSAEQFDASKVEGRGANWYVNDADWQYPQGPDSSINGLGDHPVVQVSWYDAVAYCLWRGMRLPTEAEWEKTARGTDGRRYPWGDEFDGTRLNFCDTSCSLRWKNELYDDNYVRTAPVGSYQNGTSSSNALDMAGNVVEWVSDWHVYDYYNRSPTNNPLGPTDKEIPRPTLLNHMASGAKVIRGGSWIGSDLDLQADYRNQMNPNDSSDAIGFRCAYTP